MEQKYPIMKFDKVYPLKEIARIINKEFVGDPNFEVHGMNEIHVVTPGDIVFVELPELQSQILRDIAFGVIESVKTASDLIGPLNGVMMEINPNIQKSPEIINDKPHETWICKISSQDDINNKELFLDPIQYGELTR